MRSKKWLFYGIIAFSMVCTTAFTATADSSDIKLDISGMTAISEGQFVKAHHVGVFPSQLTYPTWIHRAYAQLRVDAFINQRLHIIIAPEVRLWSNTYMAVEGADVSGVPFRTWSYVSIADGEGIISFGDPEKPVVEIAAGVMPYKYNKDARNLGEYMFRTGTYPPSIITSFDYSFTRLSGLRVSVDSWLVENLRHDFFLTTETQMLPLFDWSLSYLFTYKLPSLIEIGGGISLNRLIPMTDTLTTRKLPENSYLDENGERQYYTFKGTKLMGRVTFDPKGIVPEGSSRDAFTGIVGKEALKVYAEAAVLGLKNYTAYKYYPISATDTAFLPDTTENYYGDITQRIPIMFGINLPTWKIFDVLSLQGEWWGWEYLNSTLSQYYQGSAATPTSTTGDITPSDMRHNNLKWSLFAKKEVIQGCTIIGQIANDHTFHEYYYEAYRSDAEAFVKHGEWGWWLKVQYAF